MPFRGGSVEASELQKRRYESGVSNWEEIEDSIKFSELKYSGKPVPGSSVRGSMSLPGYLILYDPPRDMSD